MTPNNAKVTVRGFETADAPIYLAYASDPRVTMPAGMQPLQTLVEAAHLVAAYRANHTGLAISVNGQLVGHIAWYELADATGAPMPHEREIGYALSPRFWGRGYMRAALPQALTDLAAHGITKVWATVLPNNRRSIAVLEHAGFHFVDALPVPPLQRVGVATTEWRYVWEDEK